MRPVFLILHPRSRLKETAMAETIQIGIIADFDPGFRPQTATNEAIAHAADALSAAVDACWLPTASLTERDGRTALERCDGLWAAPGSPYRSLEGALEGIRFARERDWPFVGT